jgi:hypothetical protein
MRQAATSRWLDIGFYTVCVVFTGLTAFTSEFFGYRVWGAISLAGYLFGLGQAVVGLWYMPVSRWGRVLASRRTPVWLIAVLGTVVSLTILLFTRLHNVLWSEQPEVWVIERSTVLLFQHGTPYTDLATLGRLPVADDYTPYGPAMTVFGLPQALLGNSPLGDARVAFAVAVIALVVCAWRVAGRPVVPVRGLQLIVASPLTLLTMTAAGDDVVIVALITLALALLYARRPVACAAVITVAVSMKLTAIPALLVLAVAVLAMLGGRALGRFLATVAGLSVLLNVPVFLVDPGSFVEHVIRFPAGLGRAHSPAASPLPGNLIARLGPVGHSVALALLVAGGLAMAVWLIRRPPRTAADAALRIAVGLTGAIMLAPATRFGYLVYPIVLVGVAITLRSAAGAQPAGATGRHARPPADQSDPARPPHLPATPGFPG